SGLRVFWAAGDCLFRVKSTGLGDENVFGPEQHTKGHNANYYTPKHAAVFFLNCGLKHYDCSYLEAGSYNDFVADECHLVSTNVKTRRREVGQLLTGDWVFELSGLREISEITRLGTM